MNSSTTLRLAAIIEAGEKKRDYFYAHLLGQALGVPYEVVQPLDGEIGRLLPNGNWTGKMGLVINGLADLGVMVASTDDRRKYLSFAHPLRMDSMTFVTQKPEITDRTFAFVHPFSRDVWLALISTFLAVSVLIHVILRRRYKYHAVIFNMIQSLLQQSWGLNTTGYAEKLAETTWFVGTLFLAYCYTGVLLSFLSFPSRSGIKDIPDLSKAVAKGTHQCTVFSGSFLAHALVKSNEEYLMIIGYNLKKNDGDSRNAVEILQDKGEVYLGLRNRFNLMRGQYFISEDSFFSMIQVSVAYRNDFCCPERLATAILRATASGLFDKSASDLSFFEYVPYLLRVKEPEPEHKLALSDLVGAFAILICGNGVSCLVFLLEVISKRVIRWKSRQTEDSEN